MGVEIERRFLLRNDGWRTEAPGQPIRQGYLVAGPPLSVRVRVAGARAWLTVKHGAAGPRRAEYEYAIPATEAEELLACGALAGAIVEKTRHHLRHGTHVWEIDEFVGANAGLRIAEVELDHEDEPFDRPAWLGDEITADGRYTNAALAQHPFGDWANDED